MSLSVWVWGALCLSVASLCLWPWVDRWWADSCPSGWRTLRWPLTLGLSLGIVTLWLVLVGFWRLNAALALAFPVLTAGIGLLTGPGRRQPVDRALRPLSPSALSTVRSFVSRLLTFDVSAWVMLAALGAALAVLGHATYYPFIGDDELARYAYYARLVFTEGRITDVVRGYPMLMPLAYAYVFFTTGQLAEQLARVVPVLLSAATVVATGALATRWYGSRAGWAAAFALIASPLYLRWSPNGYIDIPSALFFVLCAYASDVWLEARRLRWAVLAGVCAGLALWTKQAGFLALVPVGVVWACAVARDIWRGDRVSALTAARDGAVALAMAILAGGWWYLRNVYYDGWGNVVPTPGILYYPQARRQLAYLVPFVGYADVFGRVSTALCLAGLVWALARPRRGAWPLVWAVPFTLVWWPWFSYDARFLLAVLPFYAILFGGATTELRWPLPTWARWVVSGVVVSAVVTAVFQAGLRGISRWVVAPTATYAERLNRYKDGMYPTVEFLRDRLPPTARIVTMDSRMPYYLIDRPVHHTYPRRLDELRTFDYVVAASWGPSVYAGLGEADNEVLRALNDRKQTESVYVAPQGDFVVFRILKP
jgi:hypothetical protein